MSWTPQCNAGIIPPVPSPMWTAQPATPEPQSNLALFREQSEMSRHTREHTAKHLPPVASSPSATLRASHDRKTEEIVDLQVGERHEARGTVWTISWFNPCRAWVRPPEVFLAFFTVWGSSHSSLYSSLSLLFLSSPHGRKDRGLMYLR
ncbi:hypothetical protein BDP81DRAFT_412452 [Colletotrichum phormii]|uniref:Uncharacterized protein n=1 Tax=Colletotrichum phormii TaxID=359342 RepID=A0AAJ0A668_9PEZI|nr:uncharacterized protein BDP81DRAFT_412452 [Colletotrichum phormii]KAK1655315.1 hypothetical protein BDP81DRAFT_412452 [Colletotrichum phormii]